ALDKLPGLGTDVAIEKLAEQGDGASRVIAIEVLAARHDTRALPALMKYAGDSDEKVSQAACSALGKLGSDDQLEPLTRLAMTGNPPGAEAALQSVATRVKDKPAAAKNLLTLVPAAEPQNATLLFETLSMLGGPDALAAVTNSISNGNEQVRDAAI